MSSQWWSSLDGGRLWWLMISHAASNDRERAVLLTGAEAQSVEDTAMLLVVEWAAYTIPANARHIKLLYENCTDAPLDQDCHWGWPRGGFSTAPIIRWRTTPSSARPSQWNESGTDCQCPEPLSLCPCYIIRSLFVFLDPATFELPGLLVFQSQKLQPRGSTAPTLSGFNCVGLAASAAKSQQFSFALVLPSTQWALHLSHHHFHQSLSLL